jgi:2'-5' RNA ligase
MQKKLYLTIELPDAIKESFRKEEGRWKNLNVFWTGFSHLRLTLDYFGLVDKEGLSIIRKALEELAEESKAFEVRLDRIVLGPNEKEPRMFWARIFEDGAARAFRTKPHERLEANGFDFQMKDFVPHIILASAKGNQLKGKQTSIHLKGRFPVDEVHLYASQVYGRGSVKYKLLETFPLQK